MPGAFRWEMLGDQRRGCCPPALLLEAVTFSMRNILFLVPGDQLACFMNAAWKNGLGSFAAAADSQFENHLLFAVFALAGGKFKLNRGLVFGLPKAGLIKPMAAWLGGPAAACSSFRAAALEWPPYARS